MASMKRKGQVSAVERLELEGTQNKASIEANALLGISMTATRAAAAAKEFLSIDKLQTLLDILMSCSLSL